MADETGNEDKGAEEAAAETSTDTAAENAATETPSRPQTGTLADLKNMVEGAAA
ncbi:MAG: hypothetical protein HOK30_19420, partial [Rhodospirillaceae bacterium]|nr:hypothetical protein [Rhodospirillaceae bacterium]